MKMKKKVALFSALVLVAATGAAQAQAKKKGVESVFAPFERAALNKVCRADLPVIHMAINRFENGERIPVSRSMTCVHPVGDYAMGIVCDHTTKQCVTTQTTQSARALEHAINGQREAAGSSKI